jgi:hypothetical protein
MKFPVSLHFQPSRRLRAALVFLHLLSAQGVLMLDLLPAALLLPAIVFSLFHTWRKFQAPVLTLQADGKLLWQESIQETVAGRVLGGTAFSWLVVLRIRLDAEDGGMRGEGRSEGQERVLIALKDSLKPAEFRRLQIWLRWVVSLKSAGQRA